MANYREQDRMTRLAIMNFQLLVDVALETGSHAQIIKKYLSFSQEEKDGVMAYMSTMNSQELYDRVKNWADYLSK